MASQTEYEKFRRHAPCKLADFEEGVTIGVGSFSRVRVVTHKQTTSVLALKVLKKADVYRLKHVDHVSNERTVLERLQHPFIVRMSAAFHDPRYLYLVLEFIPGGDVYGHLRNSQRFSTNHAKFYAAQVILFLEYLHGQDIVYRDLKPENLLLDKRGYLKITDFGFAKKLSYKTYTLCGTPEYMAPEIILSSGHGKGVDWWALGVLCYEMLVGQAPWIDRPEDSHGPGPMGIYQQILAGKPPPFPRFVDAPAKDLIKKLLLHDLTLRLGCLKAGGGDLKLHPWFNGLDWVGLTDREMTAPLVPGLGGDPEDAEAGAPGTADTSNFDPYPDDLAEPPLPSELGFEPATDPFKDFTY